MFKIVFQRMSKGMLLPQSKFQSLIANTLCRERLTQKLICEKCIIFSVCGSDPNFNSVIIVLFKYFVIFFLEINVFELFNVAC